MKKLLIIFIVLVTQAYRPQHKLRIFLIGDSTCATKNSYDAPETGWGQMLPQYFNEAVEIQNHAVNGRSTKSFRTEGRWKKITDQLQKGDYVFIQFGHNDAKISDTTRYAAAQTDYRNNLHRYIKETIEKGATPILLTPVQRRNFDENGKLLDSHADYPTVVREVAKQTATMLVDMTVLSGQIIEKHGAEGSKKIFLNYPDKVFGRFPKGIVDNTHFSEYGAKLMATAIAENLNKQGSHLKAFLKNSDFDGKYAYELPLYASPVFRKDTFYIEKYGAKPDGKQLNTVAINTAIAQCSAAGGGTVLIPKGLWLTGPIVMQSQVNLHIAKGALVQFSSNYTDYPIVLTTWEGQDSYRCQAPIWGKNLENIAITGLGIIDGAGAVWGMLKKEKLTQANWEKTIKTGVLNDKKDAWYPSKSSYLGSITPNAGRIINGQHPSQEQLEAYKDFLRPNMLSLQNCTVVLVEGITFQNSPAWTMHPLLCTHISVRNVTVKNNWYAQNSDAIDLESCQNGIIEGCNFDTGDDGITIKSGRDEQGRKRGVPTENFIIKNNIVYHAHGGFVIGSEMSGGVRNLYVSDCTFMGSDVGLRFKTTRGRGGVVENIFVNNINMTNIPGEAIIFDMYYAAKDPVPLTASDHYLPLIKEEPITKATPQFRQFHLKNIVCKGAETAILIRGLPEMKVKDIVLENLYIESNQGIKCIEAENITIKNAEILCKDSTLAMAQNAQNLQIDGLKYGQHTQTVMYVQGANSKAISLKNSKLNKNKKQLVTTAEVPKGVVKIW